MVLFFALMPDVARRETREVTIFPPDDPTFPALVEAGRYGFIESYCVDPECNCRRVIINVLSERSKGMVATISHAFDPPKPDAYVTVQTFLDPLFPQSEMAEEFLDLFVSRVLDVEYARRLERHYEMVKQAIKDPAHPIHQRIPPEGGSFSRASTGRTLPPRRRSVRKKWR